MQRARLEQCAHHDAGAAHVVEVAREKAAARLQVGNERRAGEHRGHVVQVKANAGLVRDGRQMQRGVGGAAGGRHHRARILE